MHSASSKNEFLLAGSSISSFDQAVKKLVENSVAAGGTNIEIEVDANSLSATVIDDSTGISCADLDRLGSLHCTLPLQEKSGGSMSSKQGLGMLSLAATSNLSIVSRAKGEFQTWEKSFRGRAAPRMRLAARQQLQSGTSAILRDFMAFQPVKRKRLLAERYNVGRSMRCSVMKDCKYFG